MRCSLYIIFTLFLFSAHVKAQDSLLAILKKQAAPENEITIATFKSSRLINVQTNETTARRCLEFRISHRFGDFLSYGDRPGGVHTFFGLDASGFDIRIGFDYGLTDRFMI